MQLVSTYFGVARSKAVTLRAARPLLLFAVAYVASWSYLFIATFLGAKPPPAPLFPPGAVLLSALLLTSPRHWWRFLVAAFLIQVPILAYLRVPPMWNVLGFTPDAVEPIVAVILIRRYLPLPLRFASLREVSVYTACVAAAVLVGATLGSAVNAVLGGEPYWSSWVSWYLGDVLACLVLAPTILLWIAAGAKGLRGASGRRFAEAALLYGGQLLVGLVVFNTRLLGPEMADALIYLPAPLLVWAAIRFGPRGIASALALIVVLAIPAVANALGPFASQSAPAAATLGNVFQLQLFLLAVGVPLFFLAALMQQRAAAESTLQASEARYQAVVETQTEMITRYRPDTTLTFVNDATCRFDGKAREELLGTSILADVPEDEAARVREMVAALLAQPDPGIVTIEHQARAADGSLRWQQWVNRTVLDADGQVIELQGIGRDITDRKRAEEALRASEARFRAAFESAAVGMALVGLDGHPLEVNHALVEMLGYSEEEVRTHAFAEFTYPADLEPNLTLFRQAVAGDIEHYHVEKRYLHKAGHLVWGHLSAGVVRDAAGKPLYLVVHLQDITERKQAEQALRDSEARYRAVVSNFPQGSVLLFGEDLRHVFADGPGLQAAGLTRVGVEAKTVWEAFPPDIAGALELPYRAALEGRSTSFDLTHDHHSYSVQVVPIQHSATRQGMVILQDVSEQRRSRDELERERTQAVLLHARSQEFRTLAEHSPDSIARLDPSGRYMYVNQAASDVVGLTSDQLVGKTIAELGLDQHVYELLAEALQGVIATRTPRTFQVDVQLPLGQVQSQGQGQVGSFHARFIPELDEDGALVSVLGIATDVSALMHAEARLAEQATELESIFEAQADGVGVYDLQGRFVRANAALRELLGLDADADYTALPFEERAQRLLLYDEQGEPLPLAQWPQWRVLRGEIFAGASAMETGVRTLDGRELWISITGAPMRAPDGQVSGVVLIARDVTARRALERQVREQATQLEATFAAMTDAVAVVDAQGHVLYRNPAAQAATKQATGQEYTAEELEANPADRARALDLRDTRGQPVPSDQVPTARLLRGEVLTGANALTLQLGPRDDRARTMSFTGGPLRDATGQIVGAVQIARDVTELQRAQAALAEQASELEAIFEAKADGVAVYDLQGQFVRANTALRQLFGFDADPEYTARPLDERAQRLLHFDEQGQLLSSEQWPHWQVLRGEILAGATAMEGRVRTLDGRELWISTTGAPVHGPDGQVRGTVLITRDVTARRALERQAAEQAAAAERTRLAHELHDTVTQDIYSAGLLAESVMRNWQAHRTDAEAALMQLPGVIRGALAGLRVLLLELRPATLDDLPLSALLRQLAEAMSTRAKVPIAVRLHGKGASDGADGADAAEPALPPAVKMVFYRVAQEALMNAAKYAKARAISVQLRTRGAGKGRGTSIRGNGTPGTWSTIELEIADDGRGFDPSAITAGHLGLAIMRERAHAVGATVQVRSQPGQGTQIVAAWRSGRGNRRARQATALH